MDDSRGWRHQTTLPDDRERNRKGWTKRAMYFLCAMTLACSYGGKARCVWNKVEKKDGAQKERRRQAGKWSVRLRMRVENWKMCVRENVMEKEKRETDVTEERGKKGWVKVKYNRIPGSSEMFTTVIAHAWIPSATIFIHCQLLNERQHQNSETSVPSRFISPSVLSALFFHLTPPADAAHHPGPRLHLIINQTGFWSLPSFFDSRLLVL